MTKLFVAVLVALGAATANAGAICNPDQEVCSMGKPAGTPAWLTALGNYVASLPGYQGLGSGICNPETEACAVTNPAGVPAWLVQLNNYFASIPGNMGPQDPFRDHGN